jgi:hypothetical protein
VEDILIACIDGLKGFPGAVEAIFPKTRVQLSLCLLGRKRTFGLGNFADLAVYTLDRIGGVNSSCTWSSKISVKNGPCQSIIRDWHSHNFILNLMTESFKKTEAAKRRNLIYTVHVAPLQWLYK